MNNPRFLSRAGRKWLAVAVLALACDRSVASAESSAIDLACNSQSSYRIVIPATPVSSTRYAAEELQCYLEKITGAKLAIVADSEAAVPQEIVVGRSRRLESLGASIDVAGLGQEGFVVKTVGTRLVIVGGEPRGTLYGVYELLEGQLGCRWFTPELERIPRVARLALPQLDLRKVPVLEYREMYLWESFDGNWMARNRLNGAGGRGRMAEKQKLYAPVPEIEARHGGDIRFGFGFFVHSFERLVPARKYLAEHPEYFALWKGKRDGDQLCCTNEDAIRLCTEAVLKGMREQPKATVFSVSQNDNMKYCQCDRCQALGKAEGTQMAQVLHLVNGVAEGVEKEFPDKIIETLAYQWTRKAPSAMRPRKNVVIRLCNIECCFAHPLASGCSRANDAFVADLKTWAKVCDRLWIWDYTTNFAHYLLPLPNKRLLDDNIRLFAANHATGVFEESTYDTPDGEFEPLKAYLLAKFLWNPEADEEAATREFLEAYYGPAAVPVREYLDLLHDYATNNKIHVGIYVSPLHSHLMGGLMTKADATWDKAESLARAEPAVLDRVRRSRMSVDYVIAEQGRAAAKVADVKRTDAQRASLALAQKRFGPFMETLAQSKLTRLREWKPCNKAEYRNKLAADLGIPQ